MGDPTGEGVEDVEVLTGGVANAGAVVRRGDVVERPANDHSTTVHGFLTAVRSTGFSGVPEPLGIVDGREHLRFVPGDVGVPPYPDWVQTDGALESATELILGLHRASLAAEPADGWASRRWSPEMADPLGGRVVCHNDVCWENVVVRDGVAVALLDFDFCAPGRPAYDLAQFARMCVPVDDDLSAERHGFHDADRPRRLRLLADAYGLDAPGRADLLDVLDATIARGGEWVRAKVEAGHPGFVAMWEAIGGQERFDRRRGWWAVARDGFRRSLGAPGSPGSPGG